MSGAIIHFSSQNHLAYCPGGGKNWGGCDLGWSCRSGRKGPGDRRRGRKDGSSIKRKGT